MTTVNIDLPKTWAEIPGNLVLRLAGILQSQETRNGFLVKAFFILTGIRPVNTEVVMINGVSHMCVKKGREKFLLSSRQLRDASEHLSHLLKDPQIPVPVWKASRFWFIPPVQGLYNLTVEQYLNCENNFAAYSLNGNEKHLVKLALNLWIPRWFTWKPANRIIKLNSEAKGAISLFYTGSRYFLAEQFPTLFSKSSGSGNEDVTQLIRALNGGDVTRNESILQVKLWDALKQLEDMAIQAERIQKSLKK